ncbi:MAG: AbrB/MazE/SpoVT family DNA-binding domain-containing protein [Candidatus Riflebacteria bacterium]|nr:AbrB/MazE/SpoVT family DNA-binding domain-containing protein [Candidatus Riflebacteria bacterium]
MNTVTVSPKFQIVIPAQIRESMGIKVGTKVQVIPYKGRIELVPVRPMKELFGSLPLIDPAVKRDEPDRL